MGSFHKIGQTGSASLAVVAPGISEALIATAIGLAAAIPAVVLYNNFIAKIRTSETELNNFAGDLLNLMRKGRKTTGA
jgi:biopolymer transport protein TolQ